MSPSAKSIRRRRPCLRYLRTSLAVASFLGIVPYSVRGPKVVFGTWQLPFHIFCVFFLLSLGCCALIVLIPELKSFTTFVLVSQYTAYSVSTISFLVFHIAYRADIENIVLLLLKAERLLVVVNAESEISYNYIHGIVFPMCIMCCSAGHLILEGSFYIPRVAIILTYNLGNLYFVTMKALVLSIVGIIHRYLDSLVHNASSWDVLLIHLCEVQDRLADVTQGIQKVYGFPILLMTLSNFAFINLNVFVGIEFITAPDGIMFVIWSLIASGMMLWTSHTCQRMKEKADEFHVVLYRIMKKDRSNKLISSDCLRGHLLKRKSFGINAAGFGDLDLEFFSSMVSATVTYSIILLQTGKGF